MSSTYMFAYRYAYPWLLWNLRGMTLMNIWKLHWSKTHGTSPKNVVTTIGIPPICNINLYLLDMNYSFASPSFSPPHLGSRCHLSDSRMRLPPNWVDWCMCAISLGGLQLSNCPCLASAPGAITGESQCKWFSTQRHVYQQHRNIHKGVNVCGCMLQIYINVWCTPWG